jgi:meso-butanediol dehydrogenase/(S,S)-butanediol dehydrogenase/diacetyl reductase
VLEVGGWGAIVTGGARGIGAGIVRELARAGVSVVVADLLDDPAVAAAADALVAEVTGPDVAAVAVRCDVRRPEDTEAAVAAALAAFGRLDVVCANAGVLRMTPVAELTVEEWQRTVDVNLTGAYLTCRAAIPHFVAQGAGCIVATSSVAGLRGGARMAHYAATKFGVIGLVQSLALELGPHGVRANCVLPGSVVTGISTAEALRYGVSEDEAADLVRRGAATGMPLGRIQTAADIGEAVVYLCRAENVTGTSLNVSGGSVLG